MTDSIIHKSYKFRIYPNKTVTAKLESTLEICRELYNAALQERRDAWDINRVRISYYSQSAQLSAIKSVRPDVGEVHLDLLRSPLRRIKRAFEGFFRRMKNGAKPGYPRFKPASRFNSITYGVAYDYCYTLTDNRLRLSKIGTVKIKLSRPIIGKVKTLTLKRECGKWYVIFSAEATSTALPPTGESIGLDAGVSSFATLSDGTSIDNWKYYQSSQKKLRIAQRRVSRRQKGSNRRKKAALLLQKTHQKIFNRRNDFQHKLSTDLIKNYDLIAVEKLNVKGLSKGVLSKQIHDVSWASFFDKLRYKAESAGRQLIEVNPAYTSQDCSGCGFREKKALSERVHNCKQCGLILDRDHNAAINILASGLGVQTLTYPVTESVV